MVRVVVDTNIVGGAEWPPLENNEMRQLLDHSRRGDLRLVVPEVVVREAANLWAEKVAAEAKSAKSSLRVLRQAGLVDEDFVLNTEQEVIRAGEQIRIRRTVSEAGGEIAPIPSPNHERFIERALRREQPFDSKGRNGYRDTVLWETVLELDPDGGPVIFIAKDKRAFFEEGNYEKGLSKLLREEAEVQSSDVMAFELFADPSAAIGAALAFAEAEKIADQQAANAAAQARLNELLKSDPGFKRLLEDAIDEAFKYSDLGPDLRAFGIADVDVDAAHISMVESVNRLQFVETHVDAEGQVLAELSAQVTAVADVLMRPAVAALLDRNPFVLISDSGYDSGLAAAQVEIAAQLLVDVVIDPDSGSLRSLATISELQPLTPAEILGH